MKRLRFALIGAALAYFFDPQNGAGRRSRALERLAGLAGRHTGGSSAQPDLGEELADKAKNVHSAPVAGE